MKHMSMKRTALPVLLAAFATGSILASQPILAASSTKKVTYKGPTVNDRWGSATVAIVVQQKKIINVKATATYHTTRSQLIDQYALPRLKSEVLKAQSAKIQAVTGATVISGAYIASLKKAVSKAVSAKTL